MSDAERVRIKTLDLLQIPGTAIYFVVPGEWAADDMGFVEYHYNEHTCPSNWLGVDVIADGDDDPHGFAVYVRSVPRPDDWDRNDYEMLFPECFGTTTIDLDAMTGLTPIMYGTPKE